MGLAENICAKVQQGLLPPGMPAKIHTLFGDGRACSACDQPLLNAQTRYEFELPGFGTFSFHVGCFGLYIAALHTAALLSRGWPKGHEPSSSPGPRHGKITSPRPPISRQPGPVPDRPIRVVIADDHAVVLGGLASLLALESDLAVVAACSNGETAIEAVRTHGVDVLLLDLNMRLDGLTVMRALIKEGICPRVVLLTAEIDDDQALEAVRLGVSGIILKEMAPQLLMECIRKVHGGERWVEQRSVGRALDTLLRREAGLRDLRQALTNRELDIVRMIVLGLRNSEIGQRLSVSEGTVKSHLHHIYEKLGVNGRVGLLLLAQLKGLK